MEISLKATNLSFKSSLGIWLIDVIATGYLHRLVMSLYVHSKWTPFMASHLWKFVPAVMFCMVLLIAILLSMFPWVQEKYRVTVRSTSVVTTILGWVYLIVFFMQMLVDVQG